MICEKQLPMWQRVAIVFAMVFVGMYFAKRGMERHALTPGHAPLIEYIAENRGKIEVNTEDIQEIKAVLEMDK